MMMSAASASARGVSAQSTRCPSDQLCLDMLKLRKYERKRAAKFDELCDCEDILAGDEAYWKARIFEIATFLGKMKNGREKMLLYYRYVKGESIERAAGLLGISRRTAYRLWNRALLSAGLLLEHTNPQYVHSHKMMEEI